MAIYVIVYGGFMGGQRWRIVANMLRAESHQVYTPTLTGFKEETVMDVVKTVSGYVSGTVLG